MGFRIEFEFAEQDGQWMLVETGTLPGGMSQSYSLHPVSREGDLVRFEVLDQPGYLQVDILPAEDSFEMAVFVRGEAHGPSTCRIRAEAQRSIFPWGLSATIRSVRAA